MGWFFRGVLPAGLCVAITLGAVGVGHAETDEATATQPCNVVFDGTEWQCKPIRPKTIFVTSGIYDGDLKSAGMGLNGLQGADNICNAHAVNGIVPPGHYVAWLSTDQKDARDRLPASALGYVLPDGTPVADNKAALLNAENVALKSPINRDEYGDLIDPRAVWTGSSGAGTRPITGYNCYEWTYNQAGVESGTAGETRYTDERWTIQWLVSCQVRLSLYCVKR